MRVKSGSTGSLSLSLNPGVEPLVVHAGAVLSMFHLLPALGLPEYPQVCDKKLYVYWIYVCEDVLCLFVLIRLPADRGPPNTMSVMYNIGHVYSI